MADGQLHLDPDTYMAEVRREVAAYDELQEALAVATADVEVTSVLDLGVGTGATSAVVLARHPGARLVAVDEQPAMVEVARRALPGADVRQGRLEDPLPPGSFDLVVSALAVHHLTGDDKIALFGRIAAALAPGGRFVLADVVVPDDPARALIPLEPGVDRPDRTADQLGWLADAGLTAVVVWERDDLVVIRAERAAASTI